MGGEQYKKIALMRKYVGYKHAYYMFVWGNIKHRLLRCSWNWAAFMFGFIWFAYRKMYGYALFLFVLFTLCILPLSLNSYCLQYSDELSRIIATVSAQMHFQHYVSVSPEQIDFALRAAGPYLIMLPFGLLFICGLYGNYLYLRAVRHKVRRIDRRYRDNEQSKAIVRCGGVSHLSLFIAFLLLQLLLVAVVLIRKEIV